MVLGMMFSFKGNSQTMNQPCLTDYYENEWLKADPSIALNRIALEQFTKQFEQNYRAQRTSGGGAPLYIIPVVFHILHDYGPENISDAQVYDAMRVINEDFRKLNADTTLTIPVFQGIAADAQIEFRLATIDPNGACTNGIDRIWTTKTYAADDAAKLNPWPNNKYINIWVAKSLVNAAAAAYAYRPGNASNAVDGIMCRYNYVGSIGQSSPYNSRTLTHELGHVLNLSHTWGNTNDPGVACGDDGVTDTPETEGFTACTLNASICNPPIIENVQNYMDYSYCNTMYTQGQAVRMQAALNSTLSRRNNLWTSANLIATGTDNSSVPGLCVPIADFYATDLTVCVNTVIQFYDQSWKGKVANWNWDFPGGTPSNSTDSTPVVSYAAPGLYPVTLIVSNATGGDTITKTDFVRIGGAPVAQVPYSNSFETTADFPGQEGYIVNNDGGLTWQQVNTAASTGTFSIRINNYNNTDGQVDEWISPPIDFSNVTLPSVTFKVANAQRSSTSTDALKMFASSNCGQTWTQRWGKTGATLATAGVVTTTFTPTSAQWRQETVSMNPFALKPNVRLKFQNTSNRGNNTYIDDLNITGTLVSIEEAEDVQTGFAIYPNPTNGIANVSFYLSRNNEVQVEVKDITGKLVQVVAKENMTPGVHEMTLPQLSPGVYMIDLSIGNKHHIRKLIVS